MYEKHPSHRGVKDTILLDAWSSAAFRVSCILKGDAVYGEEIKNIDETVL